MVTGSLVKPMVTHKSLSALLAALIALTLVNCSSPTDVRDLAQGGSERIQADADALYRALESVADDRAIPFERRDPVLRRLTGEWISDGEASRHRYQLSVVYLSAGMAMRVRIVRQSLTVEEGEEVWRAVEGGDADRGEELAIAVEANERWEAQR
jgi:hypothetical protein